MGAEKAQMINLNLAVQGKPFEVVRSNTVNQKGLGCALGLLDAQRHGKPEMIAGAVREFRDFVEQQIGEKVSGRAPEGHPAGYGSPVSYRRGACGLYALRPVKAGLVRAECRTTSHCHLHYAWLGAGLWATRECRSLATIAETRVTDKMSGAAFERGGAAGELCNLSDALLDWLHQELSWSSVCYVEGVGVLAPNRRHRRGKTHEIVLTSPDRDNLYRMCSLREIERPDGEPLEKFHRGAMKPAVVQQLGYRCIMLLKNDGDPGIRSVADKVLAGQLQMPVFWDCLEVARRGNELVAWVVDMERKGRDDTSDVRWLCGEDRPQIDPKLPVLDIWDSEWDRTTFLSHKEAA